MGPAGPVRCYGPGSTTPRLCAAIPNNDYAEILVIDTDQIKGLKKDPVHPVVDGYVTTSDEPGLGSTPDWKELERRATLVV